MADSHDRRSALGQASLEDLSTEWKRRVQIKEDELNAKQAELTEQEESLKHFEEKLMGMIGNGEDVLDINAGGQVFSVSRATLCLAEGSVFAAMFSGRWENGLTRDCNGRPFLDVDPCFFEEIVNYCRTKRMQGADETTPLPQVEDKKRQAFDMFLKFYGLREYIYGSDPLIDISPPLAAGECFQTYRDAHPRGYVVAFTEPFLLMDVHIGIEPGEIGAKVTVGQGGQPLKTILAVQQACSLPHMTHIAQGFNMVMSPSECFIAIESNSVKYLSKDNHGRQAGAFTVFSKHKIPPENNTYQPVMALQLRRL